MDNQKNITPVEHRVPARERSLVNGHKGGVLWLTGLSGAGKTTLALKVERELFDLGFQAYVLDGDNLRQGLNSNLGFSPDDRCENIRRVGEVAALFAHAGFIAVSAFISPYHVDRVLARSAAGDDFLEVYVKAGLDVCEKRDPKGLYKKARAGIIPDFTGISAPYEVPENAELIVETDKYDVAECSKQIIELVQAKFGQRGGR